MNYSNMIKTEDTDSMYDYWAGYRIELTNYIKKGLISSGVKNSWVAIWGAGGCNDIDIRELSKDYKLLLIDRDVEKLIDVREKLGLSNEICKVADVDFWSVRDEDYEMFQALLMDGADIVEFETFFRDLINNMEPPISLQEYSVDCSVVVGLASQLNARFVALLHLFKDNIPHINMEEILQLINNMNRQATERLLISVRQITKNIIITGYETRPCYSEEECYTYGKKLSQCFEEGLRGGCFLSVASTDFKTGFGTEETLITVAGNEYWHRLICKGILMDKLEDAGLCQVLSWSFTEHKFYPMLMLVLIIR